LIENANFLLPFSPLMVLSSEFRNADRAEKNGNHVPTMLNKSDVIWIRLHNTIRSWRWENRKSVSLLDMATREIKERRNS